MKDVKFLQAFWWLLVEWRTTSENLYTSSMFVFEVDPGHIDRAAEAANELQLDLKIVAPELDIVQRRTPTIAQDRFLITTVTTLVATGVQLGVFAGLFQVVKTWLASRPKAEVTILYPNGCSLKVSNASLEQALTLLEDQHNSAEK